MRSPRKLFAVLATLAGQPAKPPGARQGVAPRRSARFFAGPWERPRRTQDGAKSESSGLRQERQHRERQKRSQGIATALLLVVGVLTVAGAVILGVTRRRDSGRVWSAEHGHWHDK